jgi:hypothetical protein
MLINVLHWPEIQTRFLPHSAWSLYWLHYPDSEMNLRKISVGHVKFFRLGFHRPLYSNNFTEPFKNFIWGVKELNNIVSDLGVCVCDYRRGLDGFIVHFYTLLGTTSTYGPTTNLLNSQITKHPLSLLPACSVFYSRSLGTSSNSGHSSASHAEVLPVQRISRNWTVSILLSQSQSYFTTGDLLAISSSWRQASWDSRPETIFFFNSTLAIIVFM